MLKFVPFYKVCFTSVMSKGNFFRDFAKGVTVTQISKAARAVYWHLRSFWLMTLLLGVGITTWQTIGLLNTYFQYNKIALVSIENRAERPFPAVTVCNLNAMKRSAVEQVSSLSVLLETQSLAKSRNKRNAALGTNIRKKRSTTSCWTRNFTKYYTITDINNKKSIFVGDNSHPPTCSSPHCLRQLTFDPNSPDPFLWQFIPYSSNVNEEFFILHNKKTGSPTFVYDFKHPNVGNNGSVTCSPTQKFKIEDDISGLGFCNIITNDNYQRLGIDNCNATDYVIVNLQLGTSGADCHSFMIEEYEDAKALPPPCNHPEITQQAKCRIDITKYYEIRVGYYYPNAAYYLRNIAYGSVSWQADTGLDDLMWYIKPWYATSDGTYGIYSKVNGTMLTTRSGYLTTEPIQSPSEYERFTVQEGPKDGDCFIFVSTMSCNLVVTFDIPNSRFSVTKLNFTNDMMTMLWTPVAQGGSPYRDTVLLSQPTFLYTSTSTDNCPMIFPSTVEASSSSSTTTGGRTSKTSSGIVSTKFNFQTSSPARSSTVRSRLTTISETIGSVSSKQTNYPNFSTTTTTKNVLLNSIIIPQPVTIDQLADAIDIKEDTDGLSIQSKVADATHYLLSSLTTDQKMALGYSAKDFILHCKYAGTTCTIPDDFVEWNDPDRGNCFTFNHRNAVNHHQSEKAGAEHGLNLILNASQGDYLPNTVAAGVTAIINSVNVATFTDRDFVVMSPKSTVDISLSHTKIKRLQYPYGNCMKNTTPDQYYYEGDYTIEGCLKTCHQRNVIKICGCGDPKFPLPPSFIGLNRYCDIFSKSCIDKVTINETLQSDLCHCPNPCKEDVFSFTMNLLSGKNWINDRFSDLVSFNVFYSNYLALAYEETPIYDVNSFLSDFGGVVGNYLSCSFISIFELIILALFAIVNL